MTRGYKCCDANSVEKKRVTDTGLGNEMKERREKLRHQKKEVRQKLEDQELKRKASAVP